MTVRGGAGRRLTFGRGPTGSRGGDEGEEVAPVPGDSGACSGLECFIKSAAGEMKAPRLKGVRPCSAVSSGLRKSNR